MSQKWWPENNKDWPALDDTFEIDGETHRHQTEEAIALLLLGEIVFWAPCCGAPQLAVVCNDTFVFGCADAETLPWTEGDPSYKDHNELWLLYDTVRVHGGLGALAWCAHRRGSRPVGPVVEDLEAAGLWADDGPILVRRVFE